MEIRPAFESELRDIFRNVHEVWPHSDDIESHIQARSASQQHKYAKWYLVKDGSQVVASLGAYPYRFQVKDILVPGIAIGAVHTLESHRRKGLAARLIDYVHQEEMSLGAKVSMLYSDIAPSYYEKLGYRIQESFHGFVDSKDHPFLSVKEDSLDKFPSNQLSGDEAGVAHGKTHWEWLKRRHPSMKHLVVYHGNLPWIQALYGYYEGKEMILDWTVSNPVNDRLTSQGFESVAAYLNMEKIYLWSRGNVSSQGFQFQKPEVEIPMVNFLDKSLENQVNWQFQPIDHV